MEQIESMSKCMCQCLNKTCNHVFDFKNKKEIEYNKVTRNVCPVCGHSFTVLNLTNENDDFYINKILSYNFKKRR